MNKEFDISYRITTMPEPELIELYKATMTHCAGVVLSNVGGSDDSQDYIESAIDIMNHVQTAYVSDDNSDNWVVLRDTFNRLIPNSFDLFASDAIPSQWDAIVDGK